MNLVEVADEFITSKNTDNARFFIIKPTQWERWSHAEKRPRRP